MSTTASKRNVVDYLWEWAETKGNWAKILLQLVVENETDLNTDQLNLIYDHFLNETGIKTKEGLVQLKIKQPNFSKSASTFIISTISDIKGVNRLAENQTLSFGDNITVIYGENGSGKSGYGRILKSLGYCYDCETKIHPNILEESVCEQCAVIDYTKDGTSQQHIWKIGEKCSDLQSVSFFNNSCVHLSLSEKRDLLVTPVGFWLFELVTNALKCLASLHKDKMDKTDTRLAWIDQLHTETTIRKFIEGITKDTEDDSIIAASKYTKNDSEVLEKHREALRGLNKDLINNKIRELTLQSTDLAAARGKIASAKDIVSRDDIASLSNALMDLAKLKSKEQVGLRDIAEARGIEFWDSPEFSAFIKTADSYVKTSRGSDYPKDIDDICIYCRQKLAPDAHDLLASYRKLLSDTTQAQIKEQETLISELLKKFAGLDDNVKLHQASYGLDDQGSVSQPSFLKTYNVKVQQLKQLVLSKDAAKINGYVFDLSYDDVLGNLDSCLKDISDDLNSKRDLLTTITEQEAKIVKSIHELEDKKRFSENSDTVITLRKNIEIYEKLFSRSSDFSTDPISRKTTKARTELIKDDFIESFNKELDNLRRFSMPITLDFRTDRGQSKILQNIKSHQLSEILSEGEQKSIALAEFMTELQFDPSRSPVIFDDPVTSLDHKITELVAKRLVRLSKTRQVVIFTHSLILYNNFHVLSERGIYKTLKFKFYEVERNDDHTGILVNTVSPKSETFKHYLKQINKALAVSKEDKENHGKEIAETCYSYLRAALEVLVENDLLKGTVKRYKPNVVMSNFENIDVDCIKAHQETVCDLFETCCRMTNAHSDPDEVPGEPDLDQFAMDFEKAKSVYAQIYPKN